MPTWGARDATAGPSSLATWWAAALSLAMLTTAFADGLGAFAGGVALIGVIWSLVRLRLRAPSARSTSDLVGVVLGNRASTMVALLQMCAYLFLASNAAAALGLVVSRLFPSISDPLDDPNGLWWPSWSAVAVLVAAVVVYTASTRAVAAICAVLAGAAALIGVSLALAVVAQVFGGTTPMPLGQQRTGLAVINTALLAGLSVVGLEVITTANRQLRSVAGPMGVALAAAMVCIAVIWTAEQVGTTGGFSYSPGNFAAVVEGFFGDSGTKWLVMATACVQIPALLAVMWALRRIVGRIGDHLTSTVDMSGDLAGALMLVPAGVFGAIVVCLSWTLLTPLTPSVAPVLLIVVYLFVAEASARLPRWQNVAWAIKVLTLVVLAAVVLVPLLDVFAPTGPSGHSFTRADVLLRTTIAGLVVAAAAGVATRWPQLVGVDVAHRGKGGRRSGVAIRGRSTG